MPAGRACSGHFGTQGGSGTSHLDDDGGAGRNVSTYRRRPRSYPCRVRPRCGRMVCHRVSVSDRRPPNAGPSGSDAAITAHRAHRRRVRRRSCLVRDHRSDRRRAEQVWCTARRRTSQRCRSSGAATRHRCPCRTGSTGPIRQSRNQNGSAVEPTRSATELMTRVGR